MVQSYTVQEVNQYISEVLAQDFLLQDVWVSGEISNLTRAASGHQYFTIKDQQAQLRCVMFKSAVLRQFYDPQEGEAILVHGRVGVYEARGEYQLYADEIQPLGGVGNLYQQFEELKYKLEAEGLFDLDAKRPLPAFPTQIGVVTSPNAAAFQDVQNVLRRRFPLAEVILSPTLVQGAYAPMQIVMALARLNEYTDADVILICRGGGSIEDLWAFNDERVARAISVSRIPTVTGVGHETDFTIADFVADVRSPTPSAAAEIATPDTPELIQNLQAADVWMEQQLMTTIEDMRIRILMSEQTLDRVSPEQQLQLNRQQLDNQMDRLDMHIQTHLRNQQQQLTAQKTLLDATNPQGILERGYALITDDAGKRVRSVTDVSTDDPITIYWHDGSRRARVEDTQ